MSAADRSRFSEWPDGPVISCIPLRKVVRRSSSISNGRFRTYKHPSAPAAMIDGESDNELLFFRFAEIDPNVELIVVQPTRLVPQVDGKAFEHIPDVALINNGMAQLHEIKSDRAVMDRTIRRKLIAAAEYIDGWPSWTYQVATSSSLRQHPLFEAVTDLWRCHRQIWNDLQRRAVLDLLYRRDMMVADLGKALFQSMHDLAPSLKQILSLAAAGEIFIDFDSPIGKLSMIRYPDRSALPHSLLPSVHPGELPQ